MPRFDLDHIFSYHPPPDEATREKYERIRAAARAFAQTIADETPECADQSHAIRCVRDAVMTANAAVALGGRLHKPQT